MSSLRLTFMDGIGEKCSAPRLALGASGARRRQGGCPKGQDTTQWRVLVHDNRPQGAP
jgi:hypothetical protein